MMSSVSAVFLVYLVAEYVSVYAMPLEIHPSHSDVLVESFGDRGKILCKSSYLPPSSRQDILTVLAYIDASKNPLLVTGKFWVHAVDVTEHEICEGQGRIGGECYVAKKMRPAINQPRYCLESVSCDHTHTHICLLLKS